MSQIINYNASINSLTKEDVYSLLLVSIFFAELGLGPLRGARGELIFYSIEGICNSLQTIDEIIKNTGEKSIIIRNILQKNIVVSQSLANIFKFSTEDNLVFVDSRQEKVEEYDSEDINKIGDCECKMETGVESKPSPLRSTEVSTFISGMLFPTDATVVQSNDSWTADVSSSNAVVTFPGLSDVTYLPFLLTPEAVNSTNPNVKVISRIGNQICIGWTGTLSRVNFLLSLSPTIRKRSSSFPGYSKTSTISSGFNNKQIPADGRYIWFTAVLSLGGLPPQEDVDILITNSTIISDCFELKTPDAIITYSSSTKCVSTTFDKKAQLFRTVVPFSNASDEVLMIAFPYLVPSNIGEKLNPVRWTVTFCSTSSSYKPTSITWNWRAAVYTTFTADYNILQPKLTKSNDIKKYRDIEEIGAPQCDVYRSSLAKGARGAGKQNYTGSRTRNSIVLF